MTESEEFYRDASAAFYLVGHLAAKFRLDHSLTISEKAAVVDKRVDAMAAEVEAGRVAIAEVKRLRHDVESLRTTNETLAERVAKS